MRPLTRDRVVEGLRRVDWGGLGVELVVLFGSLAREGRGRYVDLLVHSRSRLDKLSLVLRVSEALGLDPGVIDVVFLSEAPCAVVREA